MALGDCSSVHGLVNTEDELFALSNRVEAYLLEPADAIVEFDDAEAYSQYNLVFEYQAILLGLV